MMIVKKLDLTDARHLIEGAIKRAREIGVPMCVAIVDEFGNLIAFERMDGGKITSVSIAQDKAFTTAAARKATHDYNVVNIPGNLAFGIHTEVGGRVSTVGGGIPVVVDGVVAGGIGLSSGTPQQDMDCAQAGIDHFEASRD